MLQNIITIGLPREVIGSLPNFDICSFYFLILFVLSLCYFDFLSLLERQLFERNMIG